MPETPPDSPKSSSQHWFVTTHWSVVVAACQADSTLALAALETLCRTYWYPLYAFVRRLGQSPHDSEDLVQSFFARCLEKNYLHAADQNKGRFRSFLLILLKRFMANEWAKASARKRGRAQSAIAFDALTAEQRYALEPADLQSADRLYERRWALTLLERVLARLEEEQQRAGHGESFGALKAALTGTGGRYAEIAKALHWTEGNVKVAVHRLRRRYRDLLEEEIAHTVTSSAEVQEERRYLLSILARG